VAAGSLVIELCRVIWWNVSYDVVYSGGLCVMTPCILVDCELTRRVVVVLSFDTW